jgi:hydrogenase maturation protease
LAATQVARLGFAFSSHGLIGPVMGPLIQNRESGQDSLTPPHPDFATAAANVVVGLGNDIAADDGVGIATARRLETLIGGRTDVDVVALPWAGFALLDVLKGRRRAAIIDCLVTGERPPGTIVHIDESDLAGSVRLNSFHDISYPTAMALGREMGWKMPKTIAIWGIEAEIADVFSESLSPQVAAAVEQVVDEVIGFLTPPAAPRRRVPPRGGTSLWRKNENA